MNAARRAVRELSHCTILLAVIAGCDGGNTTATTGAGGGGGGTSGSSSAAQPAVSLPAPKLDGLAPELVKIINAARARAEQSPENPENVVGLGALYYVHGFPDDAATCFVKGAELAGKVADPWYLAGLAYEQAKKPKAAIATFEAFIERRKDYYAAYVKLASLYLNDSPEKAASIYQTAVEMNPRDPVPLVGIGKCLLNQQKYAEASAKFDEALKLNPDYYAAHLGKAEAMKGLGNAADADAYLAAHPGPGRPPVLEDDLQMRLLVVGLDPGALLELAAAKIRENQLAEAEARINQALAVAPKNADVYAAIASIRTAQGRLADAEANLREAIKLDDSQVTTRVSLGLVLAGQKKFEEALSVYDEILKKNPEDLNALGRSGQVLAELGRLDEALERFDRGVALMPDNPAFHRSKADVFTARNELDRAIAELQLVLDQTPQDQIVRFQLGRLLNTKGDAEGAKTEWRRIIDEGTQYGDAYMALTAQALAEKDYAEAEKLLETAMERFKEQPLLMNSMAWLRATCPDAKYRDALEAVRLATAACDKSERQSHQYMDTLAAAQAAAGNFDEAVATAKEAVRLAEAAKVAETLLAEYQARLKLFEEKKPYFEE